MSETGMIHKGPKSGQLTVAEAGRRGGEATKSSQPEGHFQRIGAKGGQVVAKRGSEFFREIGRKGGLVQREKHGPEYFRTIGAKGGKATIAAHGREHFEAIGRKGGSTVKRLVAAAKRLEREE